MSSFIRDELKCMQKSKSRPTQHRKYLYGDDICYQDQYVVANPTFNYNPTLKKKDHILKCN